MLGRGRIEQPFHAVNAVIQFVRQRLLPQDQVSVMAYNRVTDFTTDHERVVPVLERYRDGHEGIEAELPHFYLGLGVRFRKCRACLPNEILPRVNDLFLVPGAIVSRELPEAITEDHDPTRRLYQRFLDAMIDADLTAGRESNVQRDAAANDRADLIAGVTGGKRSPGEFLAHRIETAQDTDKLLNGISLMRYLDGEKHLVFLARGGFSLASMEEDEAVFRAAANARVALHTIVIGGLNTDLFAGMVLKNLAAHTGGTTSLTRYPAEAIAAIDEITRFEYVLGYYPAHDAGDGKYREIEVKVNRPGVTVLVRSGYYARDVVIPSDPVAFQTYQRVEDVGAYPDNVRDLKLTLKISRGKSADRKVPRDVLVDLTIDAARIGFEEANGRHVARLEVRVYCGDAHEQIVGEAASRVDLALTDETYRRYLRGGIPHTARIPVRADPRYVKVVVYDAATDLAGSTTERVR